MPQYGIRYIPSVPIFPWGRTQDLTCTLQKWWRENPHAWDNSVQESRLYQKTWIWLKDSREAPRSIRTQWNRIINPMCISKSRVIMRISGGCTNLDWNGEYTPVWHHKCDKSESQMSSNHPSSNSWSKSSMSITESDPQIKGASPRRKAWWHLSVEKCRPNWAIPKRLHWGIIIKIPNRSSSRCTSCKWG